MGRSSLARRLHRSLSSLGTIAVVTLGVGTTGAQGIPSAHAAEPLPASERPATWDMTVEQLREIGLGQYRGDPVPVPAEFPLRNVAQPPVGGGVMPPPPPKVIFVNFDGETLSAGEDSAQGNVTQIPGLAGYFEPYGEGEKRFAVLQAVEADWEAYNMVVVDTRPTEGEYVMNMTGPTNPFGGGVLGIAPVDCFNMQTHSNITFAFHSIDDGMSPAITATTIGQEVAHSFGLEHVDEPNDIMNPYNAGGDPSFIDACIAIQGGQTCAAQHVVNCPDGTSQNAHLELLNLFGPAVTDTEGPSILITAPLDGSEFEAGDNFTVVVQIVDDSEVVSATLSIDGEAWMEDAAAPWGWPVNNVEEGVYELSVSAVDELGNESTSVPVTIFVNAPSGTAGETDGSGQDGDGKGCGCRADRPAEGAPMGVTLAVLGLLGLRRRRAG